MPPIEVGIRERETAELVVRRSSVLSRARKFRQRPLHGGGQNCQIQDLLAGVVVVDGSDVDVRLLGDRLHGGIRITLAAEYLGRRVQDRLLASLALALSSFCN